MLINYNHKIMSETEQHCTNETQVIFNILGEYDQDFDLVHLYLSTAMVFIVIVMWYVLKNLQKSHCHNVQNYEMKAKAVNFALNVLN